MKYFIIACFLFLNIKTYAQDDLMSMLDEQTEDEIIYAQATFKGSRLINGHTVQTRKKKAFEFLISHRFGLLNSGAYELFGLDGANIRLGFEYGLTDFITVGLGRNSFEKTYDSFFKLKLLRQSTGGKNMPISMAYLTSAAYNTLRDVEQYDDNISRFSYTHQLLIARKFGSKFSLQIMPTLIHRNSVLEQEGENDIYATGIGGRIKLTQRISFNSEYYYQFNAVDNDSNFNSIALGVDIETGGHVFQLHLTNSRAMIEKGFIAETTGNFAKGDIHFGFNLSRVF